MIQLFVNKLIKHGRWTIMYVSSKLVLEIFGQKSKETGD